MMQVLATHLYREVSSDVRNIYVEVLFNPQTGRVKEFFGVSKEEAQELADRLPRLINTSENWISLSPRMYRNALAEVRAI